MKDDGVVCVPHFYSAEQTATNFEIAHKLLTHYENLSETNDHNR